MKSQHRRWWLDREVAALAPRLVVALGGTAAQSLAGPAPRRCCANEGRWAVRRAGRIYNGASVVPAAAAGRTEQESRLILQKFVADLCRIRRMMAGEAVDSSRRVENA